jgi:hypothetical protein
MIIHSPIKRLITNVCNMRTCSLALGCAFALFAISGIVSQESEAKAFITRLSNVNYVGDYYLDPPYWRYHVKGFRKSKIAHWLYENHRYVFIDIKLSGADMHNGF